MSLEIIFGIGIICAILIYLIFQLDQEHVFFKFLIITIVLHLFIFVPKAMTESKECFPVINQSIISGNTTTNTYQDHCIDTHTSTGDLFFRAYMWLIRIYWAYIFVYINWVIWIKLVAQKLRLIKRE